MGTSKNELLQRIVEAVARDGLGDRSLRDLATAVDSSHRMILYHFGSREGLVAAIVSEVEAQQRALMAEADPTSDPSDVVRDIWRRVSDPSMRPFVQLFFETAAYASRHSDGSSVVVAPDAAPLADGRLTESWIEDAATLSGRMARNADPADVRLGIAVTRGLLLDVMTGGDIAGATESLERFLTLWSPPPRRPRKRS